MPEATSGRGIEPDGWFHTGDIVILMRRGFLRITDRKKDTFATSLGQIRCQLVGDFGSVP